MLDKLNKKTKQDERKNLLVEQVKCVKGFLNSHNIDVPFFIAGGSIFSIMNNKEDIHHIDIDVYLYKESDFNLIEDNISLDDNIDIHKTENAWTILTKQYSWDSGPLFNSLSGAVFYSTDDIWGDEDDVKSTRPIQFIIKKFGAPEEIFETFDFNCSKCAFTSDYDLKVADDFSKYICVNDSRMHVDVLRRYTKYIESKGAVDKNNQTAFKIFDYFIRNKDKKMKTLYTKTPEVTALSALGSFLYSCHDYKQTEYIHNKIVEMYGDEERFKIFEEIWRSFRTLKCPACDEYNTFRLLEHSNLKYNPEHQADAFYPYLESKHFHKMDVKTKERVLLKYPEMFI